MRDRKVSLLLFVTIFALIVSAVFPIGVLADDAAPPPEVDAEATAEPVDLETDQAAEAPEINAEATSEPLEQGSDQIVPDAVEVPAEPELASDGVNVVIIDEQGLSVPLSSPEGENALLNGQPIWCPDGVTPDTGGDSCTASFGSLTDLLSSVSEEEQQDGTIYIQTEIAEVIAVSEMPSADIATDIIMQEDSAAGVGAIAGMILQGMDVVAPDEQTAVADAPSGESPEVCSDSGTGGDGCAVVDSSSAVDETNPLSESEVSSPSDLATTLAEVDALVPGTDVVMVDSQGQVVPLTEEVVASEGVIRDPIWCPDGVTPTPGSNGCTTSYASLGQLVSFLTTNQPNQNGTIWIEQGADASASSIVLDGSMATTWANYALTLQGGWNGASGDSSITSSTTFSQMISITNWLNDVVLSDLTVQNTLGNGIQVQTSGDIVLENVSSNGNAGNGAVLDNCDWVYDAVYDDWYCAGTGTGSVSIVGTNGFSHNGNFVDIYSDGDGVVVYSNGDVVMTNITANTNDHLGVYVGDSKNFSIIGTNSFNGNPGDSIRAFSAGDIYAENLTVTNSEGIHFGARGNVSLINSYFDTNASQVVYIENGGDVFISGVTSNNSVSRYPGDDMSGARIETEGNITVNCSTFNNNVGYGFEAGESYLGYDLVTPNSVAFNGVTFSGNGVGDYLVVGSGALTVNQAYSCGGAAVDDGTGGTGKEKKPTKPASSTTSKPLPVLNVVAITGSGTETSTALECTQFSGTTLKLPNSNAITYACPTLGDVNVTQMNSDPSGLPGALPDTTTFVSGLSTTLKESGVDKVTAAGTVSVSFVIPADMLTADLAILYWDGSQWIDLAVAVFADGRQVFNGGARLADGTFEAQVNFTGIFVLVKK